MTVNLNDRCNCGGIFLDVAQVDSTLHLNVSRNSPSGSPRIANNPEVDSVSLSPADSDHCVIGCCHPTASDVVVDAAPFWSYHFYLFFKGDERKRMIVMDSLTCSS